MKPTTLGPLLGPLGYPERGVDVGQAGEAGVGLTLIFVTGAIRVNNRSRGRRVGLQLGRKPVLRRSKTTWNNPAL
jgi:hypothetical protein